RHRKHRAGVIWAENAAAAVENLAEERFRLLPFALILEKASQGLHRDKRGGIVWARTALCDFQCLTIERFRLLQLPQIAQHPSQASHRLQCVSMFIPERAAPGL